ncbi:hypothetical protein, partial [Caballeronia grimmiae]
MHSGIRADKWSLTLYLRRDRHFVNDSEKQRAAESRRTFLEDSFNWMHDQPFMSKLHELLGLDETEPSNVRWKVQRAIETGELVTIPDAAGSGLCGSRGGDMPKLRSMTLTPSQLFKGAPRLRNVGSYIRSEEPRLFANDCMAAWLAKPGEMLPDGRIATALKPFD